jgi:hypothetical protein
MAIRPVDILDGLLVVPVVPLILLIILGADMRLHFWTTKFHVSPLCSPFSIQRNERFFVNHITGRLGSPSRRQV